MKEGIVELDRDIFGARVLSRLARACAEFGAVGGSPVVGGPLVVLGDGPNGRSDVDVESADRAGEGAVVAALKVPMVAPSWCSPFCFSDRADRGLT